MKKKKRVVAVVLAIAAVIIATVSLTFLADCGTEVPPPTPGEDTVITRIKESPDKAAPENAIFAAIGKLKEAESYKSETVGTTVASKGSIFNYTQNVTGRTIKTENEFFVVSNSSSMFVDVLHEAYYKDGKIAYRKNGKEIIKTDKDAYAEIYGVTPDKLLSNHVYNQETIVKAEYSGEENGLYTFTAELDKEKSNALLYKQMKDFGGLKNYPVFTENTVITLVIKDNYEPVSLSYTSNYTISIAVLGELCCVESETIVYSDINGIIAVPEEQEFIAALAE